MTRPVGYIAHGVADGTAVGKGDVTVNDMADSIVESKEDRTFDQVTGSAVERRG
jgi:hypothetical protein